MTYPKSILLLNQNKIILELGTSYIHFVVLQSHLSEDLDGFLQAQLHTCAHLILVRGSERGHSVEEQTHAVFAYVQSGDIG